MKAIIFLVKLLLIILAGVGLLLLSVTWIVGIIFTIPLLYSLVIGLRPIPEEKRWIMEFLGEFYEVVGPGLYWRIPILQKVRQAVSVWEQRYPLFAEKPIKIDFINGSAVPKDAFAFIQIIGGKELHEARAKKEGARKEKNEKDIEDALKAEKVAEATINTNAYKMVYSITDVKSATTASAENAARSYLNGLTIEQGLTYGKAGYDLIAKMNEKDETRADADGLKKTLENWGIRLVTVRITDYDLDAAIIKAREAVFKAERDAVAAESKAVQKALESGEMHGQIKKILVGHGYTPEKADEISREYVLYWKGSEEKVMTQWRFEGEGGGGIYSEIAKIVAMIEAVKDSPRKKTKKKGEKEEEKEEEED